MQYNKNRFTFNYSNFFGSEYPDSSRKFRFFNNLYIKNSIRKFTYFAGIDYGIEQTAKASKAYNFWLTPTLIGSYKLSEKKKIAGRIEYFQDDNDVIIATPTAVAFDVLGYSLNYDFQKNERLLFRIEARYLTASHPVFNIGPSTYNSNNLCLLASMAFTLE